MQCGEGGHCSMEQEDLDEDGVGYACDNCPEIPNGQDLGTCINTTTGAVGEETCASDDDCNAEEMCSNNQEDKDCDGIGDICDSNSNCREGISCDADCDGLYDQDDNCPDKSNPNQEDEDSDGVGDDCDNCSDIPNGPDSGTCVNTATGLVGVRCKNDGDCNDGETCNNNQENRDGNDLGDACDTAVEVITLSISKGYGDPGSSGKPVEISLDNENKNEVSSVNFDLCDVDDHLTCTECSITERTSDFTCSSREINDGDSQGCCRVVIENPGSDVTIDGETGPICTIMYDVSSSAPRGQCNEIKLENVNVQDENNSPLLVNPEPGEFCYDIPPPTTTTIILDPNPIEQPCWMTYPSMLTIEGENRYFSKISFPGCYLECDFSSVPRFLLPPIVPLGSFKINDFTILTVIIKLPHFEHFTTASIPFKINCDKDGEKIERAQGTFKISPAGPCDSVW
jgi:hypothetical protein